MEAAKADLQQPPKAYEYEYSLQRRNCTRTAQLNNPYQQSRAVFRHSPIGDRRNYDRLKLEKHCLVERPKMRANYKFGDISP